jgi:hypothetical protein
MLNRPLFDISGRIRCGVFSRFALAACMLGTVFATGAARAVDDGIPPLLRSPATTTSAKAFVLTDLGDSKISTYLSSSNIDGIALQIAWSSLETSQGVYAFSGVNNTLTQALSAAKSAGKQVTLHIPGFGQSPSWLQSAGAQFYTSTNNLGQARSYVIPWDSVYLSTYTTFINALSSYISKNNFGSTVFDVSVAIPVQEMNIDPCTNGQLSTTVAYNETDYYNAWVQIGGAFKSAFPSQVKFVSPPANESVCVGDKDATFFSSVMNDFLGTSSTFWMFAADLSANAVPSSRTAPYLSYTSETGLAYQMIGSSTTSTSGSKNPILQGGTYPTNLKTAVCGGLANGASYIEVYAVDEQNSNTDIQNAIKAIHTPSMCTTK